MLAAIALTPSAPVLVPELAGAAEEAEPVRAAAIAAAAALPARWIAVGTGACQELGVPRHEGGGLVVRHVGARRCRAHHGHGVRAEVSVLARTLPRISDILARHVRDQNADLLVMGAYGHSRFREAILGGATRNMLEQAEVPVLMAH